MYTYTYIQYIDGRTYMAQEHGGEMCTPCAMSCHAQRTAKGRMDIYGALPDVHNALNHGATVLPFIWKHYLSRLTRT